MRSVLYYFVHLCFYKLDKNIKTFIGCVLVPAVFFFISMLLAIYLCMAHISLLMCFAYIPFIGYILGNIIVYNKGVLFVIPCLTTYGFMVLDFYYFANNYYMNSLYLSSFAYAIMLLALFLVLEKYFVKNKFIDFICGISLSFYLVQMTFGSYFMTVWDSIGLNYTVAFIITLLLIIFVSYVHDVFTKKVI